MPKYRHTVVKRGVYQLAAAHEDAGPYAITDRFFVHAEWTAPATRHDPVPEEESPEDSLGHLRSYRRSLTWQPIYRQARATLDILSDPDMGFDEESRSNTRFRAREVKKAVDWAAGKLRNQPYPDDSIDRIVNLAEMKLKRKK